MNLSRRTILASTGTAIASLGVMGQVGADHDEPTPVLLSFDDFPNTSPAPVALPIMERHGVAEGIFGVVTGRMADEETEDDEEYQELYELYNAGLMPVSHTVSHADLEETSPEEREEELEESLEFLRGLDHANLSDPAHIYPYSSADERAVDDVEAAGYELAFGAKDAVANGDGLTIDRVAGHEPETVNDVLDDAEDGETEMPPVLMFHGVREDGEADGPYEIGASDFGQIIDRIDDSDELEAVSLAKYENILDEKGIADDE